MRIEPSFNLPQLVEAFAQAYLINLNSDENNEICKKLQANIVSDTTSKNEKILEPYFLAINDTIDKRYLNQNNYHQLLERYHPFFIKILGEKYLDKITSILGSDFNLIRSLLVEDSTRSFREGCRLLIDAFISNYLNELIKKQVKKQLLLTQKIEVHFIHLLTRQQLENAGLPFSLENVKKVLENNLLKFIDIIDRQWLEERKYEIFLGRYFSLIEQKVGVEYLSSVYAELIRINKNENSKIKAIRNKAKHIKSIRAYLIITCRNIKKTIEGQIRDKWRIIPFSDFSEESEIKLINGLKNSSDLLNPEDFEAELLLFGFLFRHLNFKKKVTSEQKIILQIGCFLWTDWSSKIEEFFDTISLNDSPQFQKGIQFILKDVKNFNAANKGQRYTMLEAYYLLLFGNKLSEVRKKFPETIKHFVNYTFPWLTPIVDKYPKSNNDVYYVTLKVLMDLYFGNNKKDPS